MNFVEQRARLVRSLHDQGIVDVHVLEAIGRTPRELFIPAQAHSFAYDDRALPIAAAQTISQPYMVALMTQELALTGTEIVLEIGTGSGYQTAILAQLCKQVVTVERIPDLTAAARVILADLGFTNIEYFVGDGTLGYAQLAPYDGILVTAAAPDVPAELLAQLKTDGKLVIPVGNAEMQNLRVVTRSTEGMRSRSVCDCRFVKLIGENGWQAP